MSTVNLEKIINDLSSLSVLEAAELCKLLKERWGVSTTSPVYQEQASSVGATSEKRTEFHVILSKVGPNKINVIKEVRSVTGLGLIEAKNLVESAPRILKEGVIENEAQRIRETFLKIGAEITLE